MNRICELFGIRYPIIQGGMVWCSGWRLSSAVSQAGGLGLLGAGSMHPETLVEHIRKMKAATDRPWGVNVPLMYPEIDRLMDILIREEVKIVFTSAGSPKKFTPMLHEAGVTVAHVVSSSKFARKCEEAGVDAIYELKEKDMTLEYSMMNAAELLHNKLQKINFLPAQEKRD